MKRFLLLPLAALLIIPTLIPLLRGASSAQADVPSSDVAMVDHTPVTVAALDRQVALSIRAAKLQHRPVPVAGSPAYTAQIVQPAVQSLVAQAAVKNLAAKLHVTVSSSELSRALTQAISQGFGGSRAKYHAYLHQYGLSDADVRSLLIMPSLLQQKVQAALAKGSTPSDQQVASYWKAHRQSFQTPVSRPVKFILTASAADATAARHAIAAGGSWMSVAKRYAIAPGPPQTGGGFTAQKGSVEPNFEAAVFGALKTGQVSQPVAVSPSYAQSNLKGKCSPTCFFVIRPSADATAARQETLAQAAPQIRSQLSQASQQQIAARITALLDEQKRLTSYNPAYQPAAPPPSSTGSAPATH